MAKYRVHVECQKVLENKKSVYAQCMSCEVHAVSKGVAKAIAEEQAREKHPDCRCRAYHVEVLK